MTAVGRDVIRELSREGVQLWVEGEALRFRSAKPLNVGQAERLKRHKAAVMDWLSSAEGQLEALLAERLPDDADGQQAMRDRWNELAGHYQFSGHKTGDGIGRMDAEWAAFDTIEKTLPEVSE